MVIQAHGGLVFQFIGDEIEAVFGIPLAASSNHEIRAVEAALAMRNRLDKINKRLASEGLQILKHGIGIHTGQVLAASIGSSDRKIYAIIGSAVNIASRIQNLNKRFGTDILISKEVADGVGTLFKLQQMPQTIVQGISNPVAVMAIDA